MFKALLVNSTDPYTCQHTSVDEDMLASSGVKLQVLASTINYKDALAITGKAPIIRSAPLIPGIDLVGQVIEDPSENFATGTKIVVNGFGLGEHINGGLAQQAVIDPKLMLPLPSDFSPAQAMALGTAGYTAMLCILRLQALGIQPESGPILVTGASGGVGSTAISLLSAMGYKVIAATGRSSTHAYLQQLGASQIIDREELNSQGKAMAKERWAGAVDTLGSHTLANVCASTHYGGVVTCCGLAQGMDLPASVAPFILRGVTLAGVDSVMCPMPEREVAWQNLAKYMDLDKLDAISNTYALSEAPELAQQLLAGEIRGRVVIDVDH